ADRELVPEPDQRDQDRDKYRKPERPVDQLVADARADILDPGARQGVTQNGQRRHHIDGSEKARDGQALRRTGCLGFRSGLNGGGHTPSFPSRPFLLGEALEWLSKSFEFTAPNDPTGPRTR